jgi:hypothetical protein
MIYDQVDEKSLIKHGDIFIGGPSTNETEA